MDVLCQAKSGMGKTAVFVIAILQQITVKDDNPEVQAVVLCHTRELAYQVFFVCCWRRLSVCAVCAAVCVCAVCAAAAVLCVLRACVACVPLPPLLHVLSLSLSLISHPHPLHTNTKNNKKTKQP
jgi:hypothetical protein